MHRCSRACRVRWISGMTRVLAEPIQNNIGVAGGATTDFSHSAHSDHSQGGPLKPTQTTQACKSSSTVSQKSLHGNHGFNDRGFSMGNSTFGSESSVSKGKSAVITVSGLSGPSGRQSPCGGFSRKKPFFFYHGFNDRGFSIGNSTFGSESSASKGKKIRDHYREWLEWAKWPPVSLFWIFAKKTLYFNHGFNDRGFSIGNSTFGSESSVSKGKSAIITVSGLSGPSGRRSPCCGFSRKKPLF